MKQKDSIVDMLKQLTILVKEIDIRISILEAKEVKKENAPIDIKLTGRDNVQNHQRFSIDDIRALKNFIAKGIEAGKSTRVIYDEAEIVFNKQFTRAYMSMIKRGVVWSKV